MACLYTILQAVSYKKNASQWFLLLLPTKKYQEHSHHNLQGEWQTDKNDQRDVEGKRRPLLHHGFELGRVGHQQGDVQHALGGALLVGVVVDVDGSVPLEPLRRSALEPAERKTVIHTSFNWRWVRDHLAHQMISVIIWAEPQQYWDFLCSFSQLLPQSSRQESRKQCLPVLPFGTFSSLPVRSA